MINSKRELFENARSRWPEEMQILDIQPIILSCIYTKPCLNEIYRKIEKSMDISDDWNQVSAWAFHQALDKLGRYKYRNSSDRILRPKDVSFKSFNTMMMRNLAKDKWGDEWKNEREIYLRLS
jgi:hypothetical protein